MLGIITHEMWELMEMWIDQEYPTFDNRVWDLARDYYLGYAEPIEHYYEFYFEEDEKDKDWSAAKEEEALTMVNKAMKAFGYRPLKPTSYCGYKSYDISDINSNMEGEVSSSNPNMEGEAVGVETQWVTTLKV